MVDDRKQSRDERGLIPTEGWSNQSSALNEKVYARGGPFGRQLLYAGRHSGRDGFLFEKISVRVPEAHLKELAHP
jgi:hypothetical protein